jgi:hypothetical protein
MQAKAAKAHALPTGLVRPVDKHPKLGSWQRLQAALLRGQ